LPFIHEREKRFVALRGLKRMVEACDCTVVVDNAIESGRSSNMDRRSDETACLAVKSLSEMVAGETPQASHRVLRVLGLGQVATACTGPVGSSDRIQSAVIDALGTPSANLPLSGAKGAVVLFRGPERLNQGQSALAYEAVSSLVGHNVEYAQVSIRSDENPAVLVLLSGYSYGSCLGAFTDLIVDLYDLEYGAEQGSAEIGLPSRLYQMEAW